MSHPRHLPPALHLDAFRSVSLPIWAALSVVLGAAVIGRVHFDIPWQHMMGDPAAVTRTAFYTGFVSNVGALLWAAAASIFLFSSYVHRSRGGDAKWVRYLVASGLFVGLLGVDDLFMLHDQVFPNYTPVSQPFVVATYAVLALVYVVRFAPLIAQTAYPVLAAAIGLLAASLAIDQMQDHLSIVFLGRGFCEDALKLLGIGTWLSYALHTSGTLLQATSPAAPRSSG